MKKRQGLACFLNIWFEIHTQFNFCQSPPFIWRGSLSSWLFHLHSNKCEEMYWKTIKWKPWKELFDYFCRGGFLKRKEKKICGKKKRHQISSSQWKLFCFFPAFEASSYFSPSLWQQEWKGGKAQKPWINLMEKAAAAAAAAPATAAAAWLPDFDGEASEGKKKNKKLEPGRGKLVLILEEI